MIKEKQLKDAFTLAKAYKKQGRKGTKLLVNVPCSNFTHFVLGYDDDEEKDYVVGLKCGHVYTTYKYTSLFLPALTKKMNDFIKLYG